ncbi:carbon starvation protein CstA [Halococcus morrhuae DSM 1307]|uniref:Carbon starvation protein CstA n=1 Tax=Halococcus morrhuae DSM 1307 TaxID=931277 RepID=M0MDT8_HALMO|nr:carbon starvation protein A [Halococcus morrhuae]EMA43917.1 carbon starvation protein CstA [Halococcus morrhuae DSM 1307]
MQVLWLVLLALVTFTIGYVGYSRYLARFVDLDDDRETPAHKYRDGQEYVPSQRSVLLGHHYSSIAGGAPIAGPITAAAAFGWLPAILWIAVGNPLFGAVHDFMSLSSSMRHEGKSIGYIIGEYVGERGKDMLLWFAFLTIILVIAAFAFLIGSIFDAFPQAATASVLYIALAVVFGIYLYQLNLPFLPGAVVFVAAVFAGVWVGLEYPIALAARDGLPAGTVVLFGSALDWLPLAGAINPNVAAWILVTVLYAFAASVLPVWVLLQPRDFLTSSLLYTGVGGMLLAVIVGSLIGFSPVDVVVPAAGIDVTVSSLETQIAPFTGFVHPALGPIFPFLFVTIACGTISGFHSLVSSGTTAKQLNRESDARPIGYGAMLGEGLLAVTAVIAVSIIATSTGSLDAALVTFPAGGGALLTALGIPMLAAAAFIGLVFASFLLTSTDTAARLGRYMLEEIVGTPETSTQKLAVNRYVSTGILAVGGYALVASGTWENIWPLFGGANQTLAALALLVATVWLANWSDNKQLISTGVPLVFMIGVTVVALLWIGVVRNPQTILAGEAGGAVAAASLALQSVVAIVLVGLTLGLLYLGITNVRNVRGDAGTAVADGGEQTDGSRTARERSSREPGERRSREQASEDEGSESSGSEPGDD